MTWQSQNNAAEYRAYAAAFQDKSVVEAYSYRPNYPAATFDILTQLIVGQPATVLDLGCGSGDIARQLAPRVERVDAVDFSLHMLEQGKQLPNGDHPHLHWLHGRIEDVQLQPPYALVTAGESMHWMDWDIVMPLLNEMLVDGAYLAMIERRIQPVIWHLLGDVVSRYRTDTYDPQQHNHQEQSLFQKIGESTTEPFTLVQPLDEVIESYHSRAGFSRERMGATQAAAFDREAKIALLTSYPDGIVPFQICAQVVWGIPKKKA